MTSTGMGNRGRKVAIAAAGMTVAVVAAGCGGGDGGGGGGGNGETLRVGADFPLTGALSFLGESYERGAELCTDRLNEAGEGPTVELIVNDDESSPEGSARVAQRLLTREQVDAIIGTASVPNTSAVAAAANGAGVPFVAISGYAVDPATDPVVFNAAHRSEDAAAAAFEHFAEQGWTDMALLMANGPLGEEGTRVAELLAEEHGLDIVAQEGFDTTATDVTSQLASLRAADPDVVFSFTTGEPAALIARNMATLGMDVPLLVSHGNATNGFLELVAGIPTRVFVPSGRVMVPDALAEDDVAAEFVAAYEEEYGEQPDYFAGMACDAVSLVHAAAAEAGSTEPEALLGALEGLGYEGVTATYDLSAEDHHGTTPEQVVLLTVENGEYVLAE
ncbi:ABC transporter substrate-binding protein [Modestobacter lapidis]|nr:ABC transporter substrate-binding protein [Modestobacter lapidis]